MKYCKFCGYSSEHLDAHSPTCPCMDEKPGVAKAAWNLGFWAGRKKKDVQLAENLQPYFLSGLDYAFNWG